MSSEQSLDPQLIEQTKQQIRGLVNEIAQLSKSDLSPEEYYGEFLSRVVSALAAIGGAIWTTDSEGRLALQHQINLNETRLRESEEHQRRHGQLLHKVLTTGKATLVPPRSGAEEGGEGANPTDFLLVLAALKADMTVLGVVEVFQRPDTGPSTQQGYLRFVLQMCDLAGEFFKSHQLRRYSDRQLMWSQLEEFTRNAHASLDPRQTSYTIANEGRRLIDCDRVSVAIRYGRTCRIEAISGQDLFDKRSNTVRLLNRLATEVVAAGDPLWYTGDTRDLAPQIEDAVQEYVDETHSKMVAVLPLMRPAEPEDDTQPAPDREPALGALIIEQIEDSRVSEITVQRVEVVARHSTTALANALEHQNLFLMPVWRTLGKARWVLRARTLPKVVAIGVAVVALILALVLVPYDFDLQAKGTLEPVERRDVFAGIDGVVTELLVKHGDDVVEGQRLARLRNTELEVEINDVTGQRAALLKRARATERTILEGENRLSVEERNRLTGELMEVRQRLQTLDARFALALKKQEELTIVSPTKGKIVTWDLENRLMQRPVVRGQVLMRVANPDGPWQLELRMPEDRMGHITQAERAFRANDADARLSVEYILVSEPGVSRYGSVRDMHLSAEVHDEEGSCVLMKVAVDKEDLPQLRPGTTVTAKVHCGQRSIGYVLLYDVWAFIQSRVLFPW